MNKLQAGIEQPLAVLPKPAVLLQPGKAAFSYPTLGHDFEGVQLTASGNLHCSVLAQYLARTLRINDQERAAGFFKASSNTLTPCLLGWLHFIRELSGTKRS